MAQLEPMRCFSCGEPLSEKYELFQAMRAALIKEQNPKAGLDVHADNKYVHPNPQENLEAAFDALAIERLCCRTHIATTIPAITLK